MNKEKHLSPFFQRGYTLVETAIVIAVIGLLIGSMATYFNVYQKDKYVVKTTGNLKSVKAALGNFLRENGRYPCPAPLSAVREDANYGLETQFPATSPTNCIDPATVVQNCTADKICVEGGTNGGRIIRGAIPFRSLNLPEYMAEDASFNRIEYAVTENLTRTDLFDMRSGEINVIDENNVPLFTGGGDAHFVLVSHGKNKMGAYSREGANPLIPCGLATEGQDFENCNIDTISTYVQAKKVSAFGSSYYDDYLEFNLDDDPFFWRVTDDKGFHIRDSETVKSIGIGGEPNTQYTLDVKGALHVSKELLVSQICSVYGDCIDIETIAGGKAEMTCSDPDKPFVIGFNPYGPNGMEVVCGVGLVSGSDKIFRCPAGEVMVGIDTDKNYAIICEPNPSIVAASCPAKDVPLCVNHLSGPSIFSSASTVGRANIQSLPLSPDGTVLHLSTETFIPGSTYTESYKCSNGSWKLEASMGVCGNCNSATPDDLYAETTESYTCKAYHIGPSAIWGNNRKIDFSMMMKGNTGTTPVDPVNQCDIAEPYVEITENCTCAQQYSLKEHYFRKVIKPCSILESGEKYLGQIFDCQKEDYLSWREPAIEQNNTCSCKAIDEGEAGPLHTYEEALECPIGYGSDISLPLPVNPTGLTAPLQAGDSEVILKTRTYSDNGSSFCSFLNTGEVFPEDNSILGESSFENNCSCVPGQVQIRVTEVSCKEGFPGSRAIRREKRTSTCGALDVSKHPFYSNAVPPLPAGVYPPPNPLPLVPQWTDWTLISENCIPQENEWIVVDPDIGSREGPSESPSAAQPEDKPDDRPSTIHDQKPLIYLFTDDQSPTTYKPVVTTAPPYPEFIVPEDGIRIHQGAYVYILPPEDQITDVNVDDYGFGRIVEVTGPTPDNPTPPTKIKVDIIATSPGVDTDSRTDWEIHTVPDIPRAGSDCTTPGVHRACYGPEASAKGSYLGAIEEPKYLYNPLLSVVNGNNKAYDVYTFNHVNFRSETLLKVGMRIKLISKYKPQFWFYGRVITITGSQMSVLLMGQSDVVPSGMPEYVELWYAYKMDPDRGNYFEYKDCVCEGP